MPRPRSTTRKAHINAQTLRHNQTVAEAALWRVLRSHQLEEIHFRRQHPIGNYIADFCAPRERLIIEVDGAQHFEQHEYDTERSAFFESKGFRVLRFWNNEVLENLEQVVAVILSALQQRD